MNGRYAELEGVKKPACAGSSWCLLGSRLSGPDRHTCPRDLWSWLSMQVSLGYSLT